MNTFNCDCGGFTRTCDAVFSFTIDKNTVLLKIERMASGSVVHSKVRKEEFLQQAWAYFENPWSSFWVTDRAMRSDHVQLSRQDWNNVLKSLEA